MLLIVLVTHLGVVATSLLYGEDIKKLVCPTGLRNLEMAWESMGDIGRWEMPKRDVSAGNSGVE